MIDIIFHHHKYVPTAQSTETYCAEQSLDDCNEVVPVDYTRFHKILYGGDQLTTARMRGSQLDRVTSDTGVNRLKGIIPVFEDWHAKVVLLQVPIY